MEKLSYYMSSMLLFNLFYIIRCFSTLDTTMSPCKYGLKEYFVFICASVAFVCIIWGTVYLIILLCNDFSPKPAENGIEHRFLKKENITATEFLGKYSLLVVTGLTLGSIPLWWGLILYVVFYLSIGICFARFNMYYLNFLLILAGYKIYKCESEINKRKYTEYFIVKGINFDEIGSISTTFTQKSIIRLNGEKDGKRNKTSL